MKNRIKIEHLVARFYSRLDTVEEIICKLEGRSKEIIQNTIHRNKEGIEARERLMHQLSSRREEGSEKVHNGGKITVHSSRHPANPKLNEYKKPTTF